MKFFLTVLTAVLIAVLSFIIPFFRDKHPFVPNTIFYLAILVTSLDLIKSKHKGLVVLINLIHSPLPLIISIWFGAILYTTTLFHDYHLELGILMNSILTVLILSLSLRFQNLKIAFLMAIPIALMTPICASFLSSLFPSLMNIGESFEALSFSWQILMGISLAFSLRISNNENKRKTEKTAKN